MPSCLTLRKSNCKNCYKCIRNCPVKSIRFSAGQAHIIDEACVLCGRCFVVCPQNAKEIADETEKVQVLLEGRAPVVASVAPSFVANFDGVGIEAMEAALKTLGFYAAEETALGATMVKREYDRILREEGRDVVISSCCHSINLLIQKYFPKLLPCLADVVSPMQAHCMDIKHRIPGARTVFIGPCVSKKDEAVRCADAVDAVLTFEELTRWLRSEGIALAKEMTVNEESRARFFPTTGGILKTMAQDAPGYGYLALDGMESCIAALHDIEGGRIHRCFVEMSACVGSCVGGPVMEKSRQNPVNDYLAVARFAGTRDFPIPQPAAALMKQSFSPIEVLGEMPTERELASILREMGKTRPDQELNCGSCGYNTCREKAVAIYQGKAEVSMCLPFLKENAESFSNTIIKSAPNAIVVLNEKLEVQLINASAMKLLRLRQASDVLGDQVTRILDPDVFIRVQQSGRGVYDERVYLAEYGRYVEQTVVAAEDGRKLLCIMHDVTDEEVERRRKEELSRKTVDTANQVVDKQMRIVQEIASLLGETAAETKIALYKLKESIEDE